VSLLESVSDGDSVCRILCGDCFRLLDVPFPQVLGNGDGAQDIEDLGFEILDFNASLGAGLLLSFGAVVVFVGEVHRSFHPNNGHAALGTHLPILRGELVFARGADELLFCFSGDSGTAFAACDDSGIREGTFLRARLAVPAEKSLDAPKFFFGNHGFVLALVPVSRASGILKLSVVEWVCQNSVERTARQRNATDPLAFGSAIFPFFVELFQYLHGRVCTGE